MQRFNKSPWVELEGVIENVVAIFKVSTSEILAADSEPVTPQVESTLVRPVSLPDYVFETF